MRKITILILALSLFSLTAQESRSAQAILQERLLRLEAEKDRADRAFLELQAETRPVINELTLEKKRLQDQLLQVQQENLLLNSARDTITRAEDQAGQELNTLRQELESVQAQLLEEQKTFADTLNELREDKQRLSTQQTEDRAEFASNRAELEERLEALRTQMADTEAAATALRTNLSTLEQEARDIQDLNEQLHADLEESQRREALANAQLLALQSRVEQLQEELQNALEERSQAEQQRDQLAQKVHELEGELAELRDASVPRAELEQLQQSLQQTLAQNQALQDALDAERQRPDFTEELARTERERELLDAKIKTMETRLLEAQELVGREREQRHQVTDANRSLLEHIAELEASLENVSTERETQSDQVKVLLEQQAQLEADLQSMAGELEAGRLEQGQYESLQVEFLSLQTDLESRMEITREQAEAIEDLQRALGASMQEVERTRRELQELESNPATSETLIAERTQLRAAQTKTRGDMRILANHIQTLRANLRDQQARQQQSEQEREVLLNRIRQLESGAIPR